MATQAMRTDSGHDTIIEVEDASVTFDMARGVSRVLNDVSMDISRGEILGVVGESGSGKSMFASALLNAVVEPGELSGQITYYPESGDPVDVAELNERQTQQFRWEEIAMVFQGAMSSFNPTMDIRTHFRETLDAHGYDVEEGMERGRQMLADLYLDPDRVLDAYPHELSGGMSQRALIALSLILNPEVLVMDEPTAALDLLMQQSILDLLEEIKEKYDLTIVFVTHDLPLVAQVADRVGVLYAFEFVERGPTDEVLSHPAHPYTRALLRAVPTLDSPISQMKTIEGESPDAVNIPSGCSYHPRCPMATEQCRSENPSFFDVDGEHETACFHWEESEKEIPLDFEADPIDVETAPARSASGGDPVVSMEDLEVHFETESSGGFLGLFSDPETVRAVDGVDLDLYDQDVVAIVGESGCGKTTLGRAAIAAQRPTGGSVSFKNQDVWETKDGKSDGPISFTEMRSSLQMVHQDPEGSLNPNRTVMSSLQVPLKQKRPAMDPEQRSERIMELLAEVGVSPPEDYAHRYPHQLSGGEAQRVALLRALLMNPDVILADEAVSALDVSLRIEMMDLMMDLQSTFDTSYIFISHDLSNARYLAEKVGGRIAVMYLGEIVEIGPADEVVQNPKHPYTKILQRATAVLDSDSSTDLPLRDIDVPDPMDPPSGCRFHTRCPVAREHCKKEAPSVGEERDGDDHPAACHRQCDDSHPYWESDVLPGAHESMPEPADD